LDRFPQMLRKTVQDPIILATALGPAEAEDAL
jgi:hypothetical protein